MAPICFFSIFFFFLLLPFLSFSLPLESSNLLIQTCNATTNYDFCVASLSSSPRASTAADATALTSIAIDLGIANATNTSSFASALSKAAAKSPSLASLLAACADKYARAGEALRSSQGSLAEGEYDYASVHVSAAAEYPDVCRVLFRRSKGQAAAYPAELARREDALKRLCTVALDIISLLS